MMKASNSNLTSELFSELCEGRFTPAGINQQMLDVVGKIPQSEAKRLYKMNDNDMDFMLSDYIRQIEEVPGGNRSRCVYAILQVAQTWGADGFDSHSYV